MADAGSRAQPHELLRRYQAELEHSVLPFWLRHAVDHERGGLYTCIGDDGKLLSEDKYMWSQLRALWTFSSVHRHLGPRKDGGQPDDFLAVADGIFRFVMQHGRDQEGAWRYALHGDGNELEGAVSIYTDGFAIYGLAEYARVRPQEAAALEAALATFERVEPLLRRPGSFPSAPYPIPEGVKAHGISMIFAIAFFELARVLGERDHPAAGRVMEACRWHAEQIMTVFRRPERKLVLEFMGTDDEELDSPRGRAVVPGHAIESMWFIIHVYQHLGDEQRVREALEVIRWHMGIGWDPVYGGLLLARDAADVAAGRPAGEGEPWWPFADAKLWWPQTEALYALLLAFELEGDPDDLRWFEQVDDYAQRHYPVPVHGEWTQKLDREGRPFQTTVALPVKDPFHLPRALVYCVLSLRRQLGLPGGGH